MSYDCAAPLDLYSIESNSPEGFDLEVLFHPFEEQLYFPSFLIKESNLSGIQFHVVGQENKVQVMLGIIILYTLFVAAFQDTRFLIWLAVTCRPDHE